MRITGGKYRSRQVKCPPGIIRPAMDMMRESLFSILGNIEGLSFLDLFAGSGIIGIEAASRGAGYVVFVEKDRQKKKTLLENVKIIDSKNRVYISPAEHYLKISREKFNLIFLDPPFPLAGKITFIEMINKRGLLADNGILMIHHPAEEQMPEIIGKLKISDRRKYGRSILLFYDASVEQVIDNNHI